MSMVERQAHVGFVTAGEIALMSRIFGRAIGGLDIIHDIENVKVDKNDKPWEEVKMMSISVD